MAFGRCLFKSDVYCYNLSTVKEVAGWYATSLAVSVRA